jgi:23S rRNA C2498 (ribose-2'-O)-methylase RlmM
VSIDFKQEGVNLIIQGLRLLKQWISRETDKNIIETLEKTYKSKYNEVNAYLEYLEEERKGVNHNEQKGQVMLKKGD